MNKNDSQIVISKKTLIVALIVFLVVVIGAVAAVVILTDNPDNSAPQQTNEPKIMNFDIDESAGEWSGQPIPDKTEDAPKVGIKIPGYPSITLPADQETVNVAFLNPEGNPCYFTFELVLKETGESLYMSKLVPPGQAITEITMARALPAGEYEATIKITTTSLEDGSAMNGANVETVLNVK